MKWNEWLFMPLWLLLYSVVLAQLVFIAAMQALPRLARWIARQPSNARLNRPNPLLRKTLKYRPDSRPRAPESRLFTRTKSSKWCAKSLLIALSAASALLVSGCSTTPSLVQVSRPPLPANLISPCDRPRPLMDGTFQEVVAKLVESSAKLSECAEKHEALVRAVSPP